jgi:hypothetical protein
MRSKLAKNFAPAENTTQNKHESGWQHGPAPLWRSVGGKLSQLKKFLQCKMFLTVLVQEFQWGLFVHWVNEKKKLFPAPSAPFKNFRFKEK